MQTAIPNKYLGIAIKLVGIVGMKPSPWLSFRPNIRVPFIEGVAKNAFVLIDFFGEDECFAVAFGAARIQGDDGISQVPIFFEVHAHFGLAEAILRAINLRGVIIISGLKSMKGDRQKQTNHVFGPRE